jgi:predicted O-methyltransferase YrrM
MGCIGCCPRPLTGRLGRIDVDTLCELAPRLHTDNGGQPISWAISRAMLDVIARLVGPGSRTLETGAGYSTVIFAARGCDHICIQPDPDQAESIRRFCSEQGVSTDQIRFILEGSERALPALDVADLDLVLIDGRHGFPAPMIDWAYTAPMLRVGGLLIVDDTQLWTGDVLRRFLLAERDWELAEEYAPRAAVFRKIGAGAGAKEWHEQPYVISRNRWVVPRRGFELAPRFVREGRTSELVTYARRRLRRSSGPVVGDGDAAQR